MSAEKMYSETHLPLSARPSHVEDSETPEGPKADNNPS